MTKERIRILVDTSRDTGWSGGLIREVLQVLLDFQVCPSRCRLICIGGNIVKSVSV